MKHKSIVIEDKVSANELMDIVKDCIFVSDRYHGIVYALVMGTPVIALTPDIGFKMPGLLEMFKYPIPVLDIKTIKARILFDYILDIYKNYPKYRKLIKNELPEVKKRAGEVYKYIVKGIKEHEAN